MSTRAGEKDEAEAGSAGQRAGGGRFLVVLWGVLVVYLAAISLFFAGLAALDAIDFGLFTESAPTPAGRFAQRAVEVAGLAAPLVVVGAAVGALVARRQRVRAAFLAALSANSVGDGGR
jgi:ABC-type Fe3+ transport system permease subunit